MKYILYGQMQQPTSITGLIAFIRLVFHLSWIAYFDIPKQAAHLSTMSNINEDDVSHSDVHENPPIGTIPTIPDSIAGQDNISNPSNVNKKKPTYK